MPRYFAGRVSAAGTINQNSNVTVVRNSVGNYTLTLPGGGVNRLLVTTVTTSNGSSTADNRMILTRITTSNRSGTSPFDTSVTVLMYDWWTGDPMDCDFEFISVERSGS
jgi:hypothetical protein